MLFVLICPHSDCRLCEPADGGRVHPAALSSHPGEHGPQQPQSLPPSGTGDHRWTAHRAPASVSTHTCTGASRTLILRGTGLNVALWGNIRNLPLYLARG